MKLKARTVRWAPLFVASMMLLIGTGAAPASTATIPGSAAEDGKNHRNEDAKLRAALEAVIDAGATGAIVLLDEDDSQTRIAVGAARLEPWKRLRTQDQIRVGSITKTMIATIVLQLVAEGRLHLDDTVEQWLPELVADGSAITLQMLLGHTSGLFDYEFDEAFHESLLADPYRYRAPQELIDFGTAHPAVFAPGQGWSYSSTGYILIGLILEKTSGVGLQHLVKQRIVKPLHLHDTFFATSGRFRGRYAHGYSVPGSEWSSSADYQDRSSWPPSYAWAAGALVSNAPDLARFYRALLSGQLLPPSMMQAMTMAVSTDQGFDYGLGILALDSPCGTFWGHLGGMPGYTSAAFATSDGSSSTVLLVPTKTNDAISTAFVGALLAGLCPEFDPGAPSASLLGVVG